MIFDTTTAKKTAELLLQIKAIKLQPQDPFTWASGWKSPIYCDNRITLSYPLVRKYLQESLAQFVTQHYGTPDVIAGVATGAIGIGLLVAEALDLPFIYVRPEPKKHGRQNQIEGIVPEGKSVVVIEDLISTGNSSLNATKALTAAGANVLGMAAIFTYGFATADQNFEDANLTLHTLSDYDHLVAQAAETNYITAQQQDVVKDWRSNPAAWNPNL